MVQPVFNIVWYFLKKLKIGRVQQLMPVIPAVGEAEADGHMTPGVQDHPGRHSKTPTLLEIQKLAGHGGTHL